MTKFRYLITILAGGMAVHYPSNLNISIFTLCVVSDLLCWKD